MEKSSDPLAGLAIDVHAMGADGQPLLALRNFINGEFVDAADGRTLDNLNPATGKPLCTIPRSGAADVEAAVKAASAAYPAWAATPATERARLLDAIADGLEAHLEVLAQLESRDAGKMLAQARTVDIPRAVANFRFFAGAVRHDFTRSHMMADALNYTTRVPIGICGLISPWNLPLYLLSWKIAPALAMGNVAIAKPSELTPCTAAALCTIAAAAGLPRGVLNIVHGLGGEAGAALVGHPAIRCISFTGGTATGRVVAAAAITKKLSLELGGKNSTVVFADADVEAALKGALRAGYANNGQICLAGSRLFVQRPLYDTFVPRFIEGVRALVVGDPLTNPSANVGPLSCALHRDKVARYIELARTEGGVVECGGDFPAGLGEAHAGGFFLQPAAITGLPATARASTEEIFGPVVTIHPFDTEDEVVEAVNGTAYGLAGSVWTTNLSTAHRVCARIHSGLLWVNCWLHRDLRTPFGGVKDSGVGREGGEHSLEFYSEYKNVCIHLGALPPPTL